MLLTGTCMHDCLLDYGQLPLAIPRISTALA